MWLLFACGSALFAGVTAVLAKIGMQHINSTIATALRTIIVLLFSWLMVLLTGAFSGIGSISGKTLVFLLLSGCATGASWLCYFKALQLGDVSQVAPIDKSSTILTMLLAFLLLGESLTWLKLCCMLLIGAGTFLMLPKHSGDSKTVSSKKGWLFYAVLSAVFASLTSILGKVGIQDIDSNLGTAIRTCVVLVMAWVMVFVTGQQHSMHGLNRKDLLFLGLSGLTTGLSWLCYYRALQDGPASVVVPIDKLSILVTVAFSGLVLKERLDRRSGTGLVLLTAGTLCWYYDASLHHAQKGIGFKQTDALFSYGYKSLFLIQQHNALCRVEVDRTYDSVRHIWFFQVCHVLFCQPDCKCAGSIVQVSGLRCTDDGRCNAFRPVPCQCNLLHLYAIAFCQFCNTGYNFHVLLFCAVIFAHGNSVGLAAAGIPVPGGTCQMSCGKRTIRHK